MEALELESKIEETFKEVRSFSFKEKREPNIDGFLDAIIDVKSRLAEKTSKILEITDRMEEITWLTGIDEQRLLLLNDLISAAKDVHSTLIRQYIALKEWREKGIAKNEIKSFKAAIDTLKETYEDLESVFFFLPEMPDFVDTTKKLSLI